jgi:hypothetical protein
LLAALIFPKAPSAINRKNFPFVSFIQYGGKRCMKGAECFDFGRTIKIVLKSLGVEKKYAMAGATTRVL